MAITISGENNNDKILASDGVIDQISGINIVGLITASHINVGSNIQLGNAGIITATTFNGNLTGNVNSTSPLLLQTGGSERFRITGNNELGIAGANYGSAGQVLTSGGSGSAVTWSAIPAQVTINNASGNRVITSDGGTTLNGEANLTFDGATLTAHMSTADPAVIVGDSNRTGAGQHLAEFRGYWDGNHVARIVYAAGDDTTNKDDGIIKFHTTSSGGGGITERLRIASDGNVGIKSTAPRGKLDIQFDGAPNFITFGSDADNPKVEFFRSTGGSPSHYATEIQQVLGDLVFSTAATANLGSHSYSERLRITSDGKVGFNNPTLDNDFVFKCGTGAHTVMQVRSASESTKFTIQTVQDSDVRVGTVSNHPLNVYTNSLTRVHIHDDGWCMLNTSTLGSSKTAKELIVSYNNDGVSGGDQGRAGITIRSGDNSSNVTQNGYLYFSDGTSGTNESVGAVVYEHSNDAMYFATNQLERLRISNDYLVTVGHNNISSLTQPSKLRVQGSYVNNVGPFGILEFKNRDNSGQAVCSIRGVRDAIAGGNYSAGLTFHTNSANPASASDGDHERLRITSEGKIGINNSTPEGSGLDIATSRTTTFSESTDQRNLANLVLRQTSDAPNRFVGLSFVNGGGTQAEASINLMQTGNYEGDFRFKFRAGGGSTDWRTRFRMTSGGMMGFNGNPNRYLHVSGRTDGGNFGTAAFEQNNINNAAAVMFMSTLRNGSSSESFLQCNRDQDNNGQGVRAVFYIRTNGDVDSDTNSYGGISDVKLKENIVDAKSQWDDIKNIKVRNFNFKDNPSQKMLGVVAQEVETVSAGLVKDCPDENLTSPGPEGTSTKSVKYSILYMKAIKALQEAQARIETLEAKVAALEGS